MTITSGSISLAATVTVPEGPGPFPAVIIARGAGSAELDAALADGLTRRGIVVLRADARGVGLSTGDAASADPDALADDIVAMVTQITTISSVDPARVGVVGQGPDALLAARAATRGPSIAFVGALFANRSAQAYLSTLKVPVYTQSGEATPASVVGPLATWVLSLKTM